MCGNVASVGFTEIQKQRLIELGGDDFVDSLFLTASDREKRFDEIETDLVRKNKHALLNLLNSTRRPVLRQIEREMAEALTDAGFTEVVTPSIISREFITRMGITEKHDLWRQIFWLDDRRCLRPMLAPNLYHVMRELRRVSRPVSIFEVGSCFRKESRGRKHAEEFTMLNAVELAPQKNASDRLKEIIEISLRAVGVTAYALQEVKSEVYGETLDVVAKGVEVASGATGPHPLDANWLVIEPWAGVGFGLERLAMVRKTSKVLGHVGRSLNHLDGSSLNVT
jgi:phenylalanyl-tRNA synthetase alpha chain